MHAYIHSKAVAAASKPIAELEATTTNGVCDIEQHPTLADGSLHAPMPPPAPLPPVAPLPPPPAVSSPSALTSPATNVGQAGGRGKPRRKRTGANCLIVGYCAELLHVT